MSFHIHSGFYDLLRAIVGERVPPPGPPDALQPHPHRPVRKQHISSPTGFVHLVHASDAEQAEQLLRRWGPDRQGKLADPRWAAPIKAQLAQARAVAQVVAANDVPPRPLRVVNGPSTPSVSTAATLSHGPAPPARPAAPLDGLPARVSALRWLPPHPEDAPRPLPAPPRPPITPSLLTLDRAISARIYFETFYHPLLHPPPHLAPAPHLPATPRTHRLLALERDLALLPWSDAQKDAVRARWHAAESLHLRALRTRVGPSAFLAGPVIGRGAFGVVRLVREKHAGTVYAMKQLRKATLLRRGQEAHIRAERDVLSAVSNMPAAANQWIVNMVYSFQDRDSLYLILEFMGGGDLLNLLIERDVFEEDFTRFYVAEMILAIEQCHKLGFIHRDIKPDNFLFDAEGHIKLSDFGLATDLHWAHDSSYYDQQRKDLLRKHGIDLSDGASPALVPGGAPANPYASPGGANPVNPKGTRRLSPEEVARIMGEEAGVGKAKAGVFTWRERNRKKLAYSVCGTNTYMSPEVIRGQGYSFSCDWWSLGVIMFECLYGYPPFVSNSRHVTRQKILNWKQSLSFPSRPRASHAAVSLMEQLLCEPEDRLGSQSGASVSRPDSLVIQARRSGFVNPNLLGKGSVDGVELIKAHPWFRGIDWENIRQYPAPFRPELENPEDTRHFESDIPAEPLAPANGAPADTTRDPMLRDKVHGAEILEMRKALAFAGFTHKSPRAIDYSRLTVGEIYPDQPTDRKEGDMDMGTDARGRDTVRGTCRMRRGRALSM
ncbi:kinase-like domain-containing protein [Gautieria morchelliformis]|nr:kinase-like domain-containing protein [Gautieria morchelliformis]